ncbi:MAG: hypothetical protein ACRD4S_16835 [Candidatus Acidiferrales bacterium]
MKSERFNDLLNGPLSHPLVPFTILRLSIALKAVVDATGYDGEQALEQHCALLKSRDDADEEDAAK